MLELCSHAAPYQPCIPLRERTNGMHRIIDKIDTQAIRLQCEAEERTKFQL